MNKEVEKNISNSVKSSPTSEADQHDAKKYFDFRIAGVSYKIKSSHDEETVKNLVKYVDSKVSDAMKVTKNASFQNAAVLAALNIAEELILLKKRAYDELESLEAKASKLASKIDSSKVDKITWS